MPAFMTFYPIGNADTTLIRLSNDDLILFDFANMRNANDPNDKRIDLPKAVREDMADADRDSFRVVAFTHLDDDHICGARDFFWFDHARLLQGDDRPKIDEMWVPADAITETGVEGDAWTIRAEARHRLKEGRGIKVFSRPAKLAKYLEEWGLTVDDRRECIVDAGEIVPGLDKAADGVEFFVHSPFAWRSDDGLEDRNEGSIVVQATFLEGGSESQALLGSDINHETLTLMIKTTKKHGNTKRLEWDILKLFHHCSYKSLSPEKGEDKTEPVDEVKWLFEELAHEKEKIVSPSWPIPLKGSAEDSDSQPPHRQAANYYREIVRDSGGQFLVTMETPRQSAPKPIKLKISWTGVTVMLAAAAPTVAAAASSTTTRAG